MAPRKGRERTASRREALKVLGQNMVDQHIPDHTAPLPARLPKQLARLSAGLVAVADVVDGPVQPDASPHVQAPHAFHIAALDGVAHEVAEHALLVEACPVSHHHVRQIIHSVAVADAMLRRFGLGPKAKRKKCARPLQKGEVVLILSTRKRAEHLRSLRRHLRE